MNSCLYECHVMHRRLQPKTHEFVHRVFLFALDLDELPEIARQNPFVGLDGESLYTFRHDDHFQSVPGGARKNAEAFLAAQQLPRPAKILLLTNLRFLGYVFNPISIWFCWDAEGSPIGAIAEVGNTFGELKTYFVPHRDGRFLVRVPKHFYVSPFSELDLDFEFRFEMPGERLAAYVDDYRGEEKVLVTSLTGKRLPLTTGNLARLTIKYPLITLKVITLIHWHALRLWLKKIPFFRKEDRPDLQREVFKRS